ncbi:alpha-glucosidase C-terminal domain-containing protein [Cetobacterium sp.]|uniref:alpha-glucosidase C-terminal domain-containing protein n=1 Tax=Cetobacterium sp. TaxID=2071632 RepID=UPI003EE79FF4
MGQYYKVISHGDFKPLLLEEKNIYVYKRIFKNENIIVITNFGEEKTINLSNENINEYKCLLSNTEFINNNGTLNLKPYDAIILYKKN